MFLCASRPQNKTPETEYFQKMSSHGWVYRAKAITASAQPTAYCLLSWALVNWIIVISGELWSSPQQGRQSKGSSSWWRWRTSRTSWRSGCCCSWWSCSDTGQHRLQTVRTFSYSNVIYCHLVGLSSKLLFAFFIQCRCQELGGTLAELNIEVLFNFVDKDFRRRWIFLICLNDLNLNIFPLHLFLHWSRRMDCSSWLLITSSPD